MPSATLPVSARPPHATTRVEHEEALRRGLADLGAGKTGGDAATALAVFSRALDEDPFVRDRLAAIRHAIVVAA